MDGLHFFIAVSEIDREMHRNVRSAGPHGISDPDEYQEQHTRLRRLFHLDRAPVETNEPPRRITSQPRQAA